MIITIHIESDDSLQVFYRIKNKYYASDSTLGKSIQEVIKEFEADEERNQRSS